MEKVQKTGLKKPEFEKHAIGMQNPIELDNKAFDIVDGDKKMLDYLTYSGTITKGSLAANGVIKLCPNSYEKYNRDYGAYASAPKEAADKVPKEDLEDYEEEPFNEWDNIFANNSLSSENPFYTSFTQ